MAESTQHKLDRIRPPRVQITYDVEIGDAIEKKELPFVLGMLADLSGKPSEPLPKLALRRFVEIDRDNFNSILASTAPRIAFQVDNKLSGDDATKMNVELKFNHIDDFEPVNVLQQVPALAKLYDARQKLRDLLTKLDGNDELDHLLQDILSNTPGMEEIKAAAASAAPAAPDAGDAAGEPEGAA